MVHVRRIFVLLGLFAIPAGAGFAQAVDAPVTGDAPTGQGAVVDEQANGTEAGRDPFSLDNLLTDLGTSAPDTLEAGVNFRPSQERPALPQMHLRGVGRMGAGDDPTALLDIDGVGLFVVNVDDTISLQDLAGDNVLRILEINEISVTVEAGSFGELIVVR